MAAPPLCYQRDRMNLRAMVSGNAHLRRVLFPLFSKLNPGDITIRHHYTGDRVRLHSFRHRGYWWSGRDRESETMRAFSYIVRPGDTVFEVGAHIGYITLYFSHLVGERGRVRAFEPGENNLPYTRQNLGQRGNITLVEKAVGDHDGHVSFYLEDLSGQNNSMIPQYPGLTSSFESAARRASVREVTVELVTLDSHIAATGQRPDFLKIDVEGAELGVLKGAHDLLAAHHPPLMVETAGEVANEVIALLHGHGYTLFRPNGRIARTRRELDVNSFCLHPELHAPTLRALGWPSA